MKKIKISQLPVFDSLKGLYTIGTDNENRSVKVSLEFVENETRTAVANAENATEAAQNATIKAQAATEAAQTATANADTATDAAKTATEEAIEATQNANAAATEASNQASRADVSTGLTIEATANANAATEASEIATTKAKEAAENANAVAANIQALIDRIIPTGLTVEAPERITYGNNEEQRIIAKLEPESVMQNIIYVSDNEAVSVDLNGRIQVKKVGKSVVHVIPTCNVALAKTILIKVEEPTLRLADTRTTLRLTQSGALMLN